MRNSSGIDSGMVMDTADAEHARVTSPVQDAGASRTAFPGCLQGMVMLLITLFVSPIL
jgi:hypothetical protein